MELLQRRKFCREFLNGYNEKLHPQIISKVFEIGLLTLKKKYNKLSFSIEELDDIIKDLSGKKYVEIVPLPPLKKIDKIPIPPQRLYSQPKKDYYFNTESNNNSDILETKIVRKNRLYENTLKNPNFITQNSAIYPNWWWNNKEEDEIEKPKNNIRIIYNEGNNENINNFENNNKVFEENNYNNEFYNSNEITDKEINYNNYPERQEIENDEIVNKNYTMKKLTMNSTITNKNNSYDGYSNKEEYIFNGKQKHINNLYNSKDNKSFKKENSNKKNNIKKIIKK